MPFLKRLFKSTNTHWCSRHSTYTVSEFHAKAPQATASEGLVQGPTMAARAGLKPPTLLQKGIDYTKAPPHFLSWPLALDSPRNDSPYRGDLQMFNTLKYIHRWLATVWFWLSFRARSVRIKPLYTRFLHRRYQQIHVSLRARIHRNQLRNW